MIDQYLLTEQSRKALADDLRVLQGYRLGMTDREHIERLLNYMDPPKNSLWLDIGCGFGEPARLMREVRPDLDFYLVNNNEFQLDHAPEDLHKWYADMHALPFRDEIADGAMFLFSLCHADDAIMALAEARRVVKPGGKLFVFDYIRTKGDDFMSWHHLAARFFGLNALHHMCRFVGFQFGGCIAPEGSDAVFRSVFEGDQELYERIFDDLTPVVWWATRR
jgi:ubiquinone/menaquinone biosynthesis C-methylase UbiE